MSEFSTNKSVLPE